MTDNRPPEDRDYEHRRKAYDFDNDEEWDVEKFLAQRQQRAEERQRAQRPSQQQEEYRQPPAREEPQGYRRPEQREQYARREEYEQPRARREEYEQPRTRREEYEQPRARREEPQGYRRSPERAQHPQEGYRRPANRKKNNGNGKLYVLLAVILALILVLVIWLVSTIKNAGTPKDSPASESVSEPSETEPPTEAPEVRAAALVKEADTLAASYDYDNAIAKLEEFGSDWQQQPTLTEAKARYEAAKQQTVRWADTTNITHVFFHTLIVDTDRAFDSDYTNAGYNQYMTTIAEFEAMLEEFYKRGFVLVRIHDIAKQVTDENGETVFEQGDIYLPPGKTPMVMSQDDVNYYEYMVDGDEDHKPDAQGDGFADHLIVGEDGYPTCTYVDANGQKLTGDYDLVPILEKFCQEHPDFSYRGARAIVALTGYQGAFGYRTNPKWVTDGILTQEEFEQQQDEVRKVAQCLRDKGWELASHSWGHINFTDSSAESIATDTQKWEDQVESLIGDTDIFIYPHGADIAGVEKYSGAKYDALYNAGFRYFCNVDGSTPHWVQIWNKYVRQGRRNLDGYRMWYNPDLLDDLFDVDEIFDPARPTPVPSI